MTGLMDLPTLWAAVADTARTRPELPCLANSAARSARV